MIILKMVFVRLMLGQFLFSFCFVYKGKLKKLPYSKNNTAQPVPIKTKHVKKSNSETSCDSSEHENLVSKPKRGELLKEAGFLI